eukprot:tig00000640_g2785.t1
MQEAGFLQVTPALALVPMSASIPKDSVAETFPAPPTMPASAVYTGGVLIKGPKSSYGEAETCLTNFDADGDSNLQFTPCQTQYMNLIGEGTTGMARVGINPNQIWHLREPTNAVSLSSNQQKYTIFNHATGNVVEALGGTDSSRTDIGDILFARTSTSTPGNNQVVIATTVAGIDPSQVLASVSDDESAHDLDLSEELEFEGDAGPAAHGSEAALATGHSEAGDFVG